MCRWLGYSGDPIAPAELVFKTHHSLIDQSLSATASAHTTNGDGFGVGWYDQLDSPGLYKHIRPAWNDSNLRDVCEHALSPLFLAHVRSSTGTEVQRSNCHPFRHRRLLFVHNGCINGYRSVRRRLAMSLPEPLFGELMGTTDTELMFYLAVGHGLEQDIPRGVAGMVRDVENACRDAGEDGGVEMTLGITDGERLHAFRYSTVGQSPTLYYSRAWDALSSVAPPEGRERLERFPRNARVVVSEPLVDLPDAWAPVPESSWIVLEDGRVEVNSFGPAAA